METQQLKIEEENFWKEFDAHLSKDNQILISDGIINIEQYVSSYPKILWINKEVNSEGEDKPWDLREVLNALEKNGKVKNGWEKTFNPIVYIIYGIMNHKNWEEIPNTWDELEIIKVLQKIAYINVKKTPGRSSTVESDLINFHSRYSDFLERQIKLYNPDVIICGGSYEIIADSLSKIYDVEQNMKFKVNNEVKANIFFYNNDVLIVDAYHPCIRSNKEQYCDGMINGVLKWLQDKKI